MIFPFLQRFWKQTFLSIALLCSLAPTSLLAHKPSDSYLTLRLGPRGLEGEWHVALRDLDDALGLDANDDGVITWDELKSRQDAIFSYAQARLHVRGDGRDGKLRLRGLLVDNHSDGAYAVLRFLVAGLPAPRKLEIRYRALFDLDPQHRGLMRLENRGVTSLTVFSPANPARELDLSVAGSQPNLLTFIGEGIRHIGSGYDHLLFLVALLLPAVLRRTEGHWEPAPSRRAALGNVLKIVTAFTVAHSITLSLAAFGVVQLPERLVESAIAASIVLAAVNNLAQFFSDRAWLVAFGFGLIHGFGFANALRDIGLRHGQLAVTLFGFNLGVELGQLAVVAVFLPLPFGLRGMLFYQRFVLRAGSTAICAVATAWLAERLFDFKCLPF